MPFRLLAALVAGLGLGLAQTSCIGTDFVDELIGTDLSRLEIDAAAVSVEVGKAIDLTAQFYDFNGDPATATLRWSSRNEAVARVDDAGRVTGVATGQTLIEVIANSTWRDSVLVSVVSDPNAVATVTIAGPATANLPVGESLQLQVEVRNAAGDIISGRTALWSSEAPAIASVDANGLLRGVAAGRTTITARVDGISSPPLTVEVGGAARRGAFTGRNGYSASGEVTVLREGENNVVRLEANFRTQSGPGLHVYLSQAGNAAVNGVDLGALKATSGEQRYVIPAAIDPANYSHVLIYCQPFRVTFADAELK